MTTERKRTNRLAEETSPYLLQHATNPVEWYPWGPEALARAKELERPILLSIGYAACHWCHVMERESFENEGIARLMNEHFVCIKVDREERPDLDDIYMTATMALSGSGGWPMTVFLTPEQEPFFAGTYFPPDSRYGRPGFPVLLERIAEMWKGDRATLQKQAEELTGHVQAASRPTPPRAISADALRMAARQLARDFDPSFGGFGRAPKFPPCASVGLLLRHHATSAEPQDLAMVRRTLDGMKNGGIYDQLGGGFARYSVDERWLVPHFEKMLYDNAQLVDVYLDAYAATGDTEYRRVARETLDYVLREMQGPAGGYFSSSDADSEGVEGRYFVWTKDQVDEVLGPPFAEHFCLFYDVTPDGNWEGTNVLNTPRSLDAAARELGIDPAELSISLEESRERMLEARTQRVPPGIDDKVLVGWNGLMIRAMANGFRVLRDDRYLTSAGRAADYLLSELRRPDGGLHRTARAGKAHLDGYLEDYAYFADALVSLYEAGGGSHYLDAATELAERMISDFGDPDGGAFFQTARGHEELLVRSREGHDGALPNPNAVACRALGRLAAHLDRSDFREQAVAAAMAYGAGVGRQPRAFATLLSAADFLLAPPVEIVFAGDPTSDGYQELVRTVAERYLPNRIEAHAAAAAERSPLTAGKPSEGQPRAFLCEGFTCQAPIADAEELGKSLDALARKNRERAGTELGRRRIAGRATAEGTARLAARSPLGKDAYCPLRTGDEVLQVSRVGFGAYRAGLDHPEHRAALTDALAEGFNLIDTAPTFALGDSERLVGQGIAALIEAHQITRDEVVVVSKVGLAQGAAKDRIDRNARRGQAYDGVISLSKTASPGGDSPAYCLDPRFIADEIGDSLERLGLDHLDVCLVQNPEHLWLAAAENSEDTARRALQDALEGAFRHLESEVEAGRIGCYGVASSLLSQPTSGFPSVDELRRFAVTAAGDDSHFRVVELPLNLVETGALELRGAEPGTSALERAAGLGLEVFVGRPLSAIVDDALVRLADPPSLGPADAAPPPEPTVARRQVAALEAEFETTLAPALRVAGLVGKEPVFNFGGALGEAVERVQSLQQFEQAESTLVTPRARELLSNLDRAFSGPHRGLWENWRDRYVEAVGHWLAAVRYGAQEKNRRVLDRLEQNLRDASGLGLAFDGPLREAPWSQRALALVASIPGVTSVLTGMRRRPYVADASAAIRLPIPEGVEQSLRSTS